MKVKRNKGAEGPLSNYFFNGNSPAITARCSILLGYHRSWAVPVGIHGDSYVESRGWDDTI